MRRHERRACRSGRSARIGVGGDPGQPWQRARSRHRRRSSANTDTQSSVRQAGTTPWVEIRPRLGFSPTILLRPAGTRPEPAVSVPSASGTSPAATATAEPELDPPGISSAIEQIPRHAIGRAHADQAGGELVEIGLADDERAGRAQARHRGRIVRRLIAEGRTGRRRRHAGDVDIVLHRDGNAIKRAPGGSRAKRARFGQYFGFRPQADEYGAVAMRADAREAAGDGLFRRCRPRPVGGHDRGERSRTKRAPKAIGATPAKACRFLCEKSSLHATKNRKCRCNTMVATRPHRGG